MQPYFKLFTAKAPVNIAVIKYWGKKDEALKIPINDSISGTLDINDMCATTSVAVSDTYEGDELWLNNESQSLDSNSNAYILLEELRSLCQDQDLVKRRVHIVSYNNFPTAAGLASSAAGFACLTYVLGHIYGVTDRQTLSKLARRCSGSACRSLFGGFVQWHKGDDNDSSIGKQIVDHDHWKDMKVVICVISDKKKDVSSSKGMRRSVETSELLQFRAREVVPKRIQSMTNAIKARDFETFANITMQDSNQFHAVCLDSYPPIFYMNETSRQVIKICTLINEFYGKNRLAYTFDAGPNACIYLLDESTPLFIGVMRHFFPLVSAEGDASELPMKGSLPKNEFSEIDSICQKLIDSGIKIMPNTIDYLINTTIGEGPKMLKEHIDDIHLRP